MCQEKVHGRSGTFGRRDPERCEPGPISHVGVRFVLKQQQGNGVGFELHGLSQYRIATRVPGIRVRALGQQPGNMVRIAPVRLGNQRLIELRLRERLPTNGFDDRSSLTAAHR